MAITPVQKTAIEEVIKALLGAPSRRTKRHLADMFLDLVDRDSWPEYYEVHRAHPFSSFVLSHIDFCARKVIPQPRCIHGVQATLAQNKYKNALDAFEDLNLVFLNALHYNEDGSQIAKDAATLRVSTFSHLPPSFCDSVLEGHPGE